VCCPLGHTARVGRKTRQKTPNKMSFQRRKKGGEVRDGVGQLRLKLGGELRVEKNKLSEGVNKGDGAG